MKFYIARDKDGTLCLYEHEPERYELSGSFCDENCEGPDGMLMELPKYEYPEVTWENSPVECELVTKI